MTGFDALSVLAWLVISGFALWLAREEGGPNGSSSPRSATDPAGADRPSAGSGFVCVEAEAGKPLNPQVWVHEARARAQGLVPVVEVFASSSKVSVALTALWREGGELAQDTLAGIYLVRVDLATFGPDEVLGLTPYALHGVPLFVAWTSLGQVLPPSALTQTAPRHLALPLSAFFDDVAKGRRHDLHAAPPVPVVELARRQAEALGTRGKRPGKSASGSLAEGRSEPAPTVGEQLARSLDAFLQAATLNAERLLEANDLRSDHSMHSLRQLDAFLDEAAEGAGAGPLSGEHAAPLAVYFGEVIATRVQARWVADREGRSIVAALGLRVSLKSGEELTIRPVELVLERLQSADVGLYGHAVDLVARARETKP